MECLECGVIDGCDCLVPFWALSDSAKETALDKDDYDRFVFSDWYEYVFEKATAIGNAMGFEMRDIYFSGFWSQGDGACFTGHYSWEPHTMQNVVNVCEQWGVEVDQILMIASELVALQAEVKNELTSLLSQSGNYYHEHSVHYETSLEEYCDDCCDENKGCWHAEVDEDQVFENFYEICRDFMRWIFQELEREYDSLVDRDYRADELSMNDDILFTLDGVPEEQYLRRYATV